tara:strand:- start:2341 stop:3261 length:921 start_codon:yes stop_codon:yes gene_type:complete
MISSLLSACQEGHSFSSRYHYGAPVGSTAANSPYPVPVPRDKPRRKVVRAAPPKKSPVSVQSGTITVRKGDTIYALARRHNVTVRAIIKGNALKPPYLLYPGQKLKSPAKGRHKVIKGDTIYSLSRRYQVDMTQLARLNQLQRPYTLAIGQTLKVPGNGTQQGPKSSTQKKHASTPPPPRSGKGFLWPVKGRLLSSFGAKAKGYHNDGINIAANSGSYIQSAESGVVVHAGRKIKGYGNLILIRHSNGWVTAYAHCSNILVTVGQKVKRGQAIARVGRTGGVSRPQLHFEMRKGAQAVNPVKYLVS